MSKVFRFKMKPEELQQYLMFRKKHFATRIGEGRGSYTRKKKHKEDLRNVDSYGAEI